MLSYPGGSHITVPAKVSTDLVFESQLLYAGINSGSASFLCLPVVISDPSANRLDPSETMGNHQSSPFHLNLPSLIRVLLIVAVEDLHVLQEALKPKPEGARPSCFLSTQRQLGLVADKLVET